MTEAQSFEGLLHRALTPVEPPEDLGARLESALVSLTASAAEELEAWELSAMRDPRNWARPAAAVVVGGSAGVALVVLRARRTAAESRRSRLPLVDRLDRRSKSLLDGAGRAARDLRNQATRIRGF